MALRSVAAERFQLAVQLALGAGRNLRNPLVEEFEHAEALPLAELSDPLIVVLDGLADHFAFGLGQPFGGLAEAGDGGWYHTAIQGANRVQAANCQLRNGSLSPLCAEQESWGWGRIANTKRMTTAGTR